MFTGIVEKKGKLISFEKAEQNIIWTVAADFSNELIIGQSVSINGACHTVLSFDEKVFRVESIKETLELTNFSQLKIGDDLNLERCLMASSRFDGHIVQGHIDGQAKVINLIENKNSWRFYFEAPDHILRYCVLKGSITLDGVALTLTDVQESKFSVDIIPHTFENTNFQKYTIGHFVNVETDIIARYIEKWSGLSS